MRDTTRVALVTGAGQGIGAAIARALADDGFTIVAMSPSGRAKELAEGLGGAGLNGTNTDPKHLQALVDLALERYGSINVVVNGAGHAAKGPVLDLTDEDWLYGFDMYLMSVIRMARLVTPHMTERGSGAIVNISTSSPFEPNAKFPVSATVRASLAAFTKLYTNEHGPAGVRMNNVLPGFTKPDPTEVPGEWTTGIPLKRAGSTAEVAELVRFLASEKASYITGQNIRVDGGVTRSV